MIGPVCQKTGALLSEVAGGHLDPPNLQSPEALVGPEAVAGLGCSKTSLH